MLTAKTFPSLPSVQTVNDIAYVGKMAPSEQKSKIVTSLEPERASFWGAGGMENQVGVGMAEIQKTITSHCNFLLQIPPCFA